MERGRTAAANSLVQSTLLGELLEHAEIGALAIDEGHYVAANEYACALLGFERDELIGRRVGELEPLSELPAQFAENKRAGGRLGIARKDGSPIQIEYRLVESQLAGIVILVGLFWPV